MAERKFNMSRGLLDHPMVAALVGNVLARWNVTERLLASLLPGFMGTDIWQANVALASLINSRARLDMIEAAGNYALHGSALFGDFEKLMKLLHARLDARNYYAHSVFATDEKGRLVTMTPNFDWTEMEANKRTQKVRRIVTVKAVESEHTEMIRAYQAVIAFQERLHETAPLFHGTQIPSVAFLRRAEAKRK